MSLDNNDVPSQAGGPIVRHKAPDRLLHWIFAVCVLVLLFSSFLPIVGLKFEWVTIHWVTGLILAICVVRSHLSNLATWQMDDHVVWPKGYQSDLVLPEEA